MSRTRTKLRRLLADPKVTTVVVERRDRLRRMNTELVEAALSASGRRLAVLDAGEVDGDLVREMAEVLRASAPGSTATLRRGSGPRRPSGASNRPWGRWGSVVPSGEHGPRSR